MNKLFLLIFLILIGCKCSTNQNTVKKESQKIKNDFHSLSENDTTRNFIREIESKNFFESKNINDSIPLCSQKSKGIGIKIYDLEYTDTKNQVHNYHKITSANLKIEINYLNSLITDFKFNDEKFKIVDSPFEQTLINDFSMDLYFANSYLFQCERNYLIQICPPDWTGLMMQFRLYYFIDIKNKIVHRYIA